MKSYIPSLNGLRALSILIVIFGHVCIKNLGGFHLLFPFSFFFDGNLGVNVFFVISGFLITTLLLEEEREYGTISLRNFYVRRTFRIFPAYYFLLVVYAILQLSSVIHLSTRSWLSSIFYYKYLDSSDWETGHFWSLSVEEHFYLIWPLVFMLWRKGRVYFAYAGILLVLFFRYNSYAKFFNVPVFDGYLSIFQRGDAIMIGCLFALYRERMSAWISKISQFRITIILILACAALVSDGQIVEWNMKYHLHLGILLVPLSIGSPTGTITNVLIGLLMLVSINCRGIWFKFLNLPVMNYIGKLSYSLYLWQQLFFTPGLGIFRHLPFNLICITLCALGCYYFIERPFLKMKKRYEVSRNPLNIRDNNHAEVSVHLS